MPTITVPFSEDLHLDAAVTALLHVRQGDPTYPPPRDADATAASFSRWLLEEEVLGRWVALVDGKVAGHLAMTRAHPYLNRALSALGYTSIAENGLSEVSKFYVDPVFQGCGVGTALFQTGFEFARARGCQPALAVISTSVLARKFYSGKGMLEVGSFMGIHGENFVFVEDAPVFTMQEAA
ncbi:GNAT family N-acetyltransferase [Arthrobacter caoxuetaonis]|uniref:GNAT family N-acetyltransferase n=1 Tax=Arthrobacter caoxuetaonis TaxID=2886935 RepID=A0A9X1SGD8_9MICC|nr:GNAT family N-acetyltransferase [Arthrobacter caoxuetaonis]MCC3299279.1 GNAT family N-acetyltransferase [Arthrobacter caoxuetaonis]USQ59227.1 GNAT family N-acetyltransferase [Arthrobacter caoxuetaonis]